MSILTTHLGKSIGTPAVRILSDINLEIKKEEFVALTGRSGSGKSTLLYLLSGLDSPTEGAVRVGDIDFRTMPSEEIHNFRNRKIGFVFQFHYLINELTALENVLMPTMKTQQNIERTPYAEFLLQRFGLADKKDRLPRQLSGGEQQRVAIARALIMEPEYLFADEPTGSLDSQNSETVMEIIRDENRNRKTTVVMVTHDAGFAARATRQIRLADGRIVAEA